MRKAFKLLALVAGIVATAVSCNTEIEKPETIGPLHLVIRASAPETKTAITNNGDGTYSPSWSANDAIGVYFTNVTGNATEFVNEDAGDTALFEPNAEITSVSGNQTLYAFYPLSAFNAVATGTTIRVNVKDAQTPDAIGTFDKTADILVAEPFAGNITTINNDGGIIDLAFARILSVVKITPSESATVIDGEYVKSIKVEYDGASSDAPLTGRVALDLNTGELGEWTIKNYSVSAAYGDGVFALNGTNAAYLLVNPITIVSGKTVTFTVKTDKHDASKSFTLGKDLSFPAGNIATIALSIDDNWTIEDNTLDPNIIFKAPFTAGLSSTQKATYSSDTYGNLGVVGTSKSSISYTFAGSDQIRENSNHISSDDGNFYWCTSSTGLTIGGINVGTNQYFNLSFDRYTTQGTATLTISISEDGDNYFSIPSSSPISIANSAGRGNSSYNFSLPAGNRENIRIKIENGTTNGVVIDNVTLTRLDEAGAGNNALTLTVEAVDPTLSVEPSPVNLTTGGTQQLSVTGTNGTIHYSSNSTAIATVSSTGLVTAVAEGSTTISITSDASANYNAGSTSVTVNVTAAAAPKTLPYENTLVSGHTDFTFNVVSAGGLGSIWTDTSNGIQANAYQCTSSVEAYAESPEMDLTGVDGAKLTFTHEINYFANVATAQTQATLQVRAKNGSWGDWGAVTIPTYPASLGNSTATANVDLSAYAGNIIQFRFKYLATTTNPGRWRIKNLSVTEVVPATLSSISVSNQKTSFTVGNSFSFDGTVTAHYSDDSTADVTAYASFTGYNLSSTGDQTVTVSYTEGNITKTTTYSITVSEPTPLTEGDPWYYTFGDNPFVNNAANLTYSGTILAWSTSVAPGYINDALSFGTNNNPASATLSTSSYSDGVSVIAISIKANSNKAVTAAVSVGGTALKYGDNATVTQSGNTLTTYEFVADELLSGQIQISFTNPTGGYQIKTIKINPEPVTLSSISISGQTTSFTVGDTFSFGGTVTAHYSDERTANVTTSASFTGYDLSSAGNQTVTVSYTEGNITRTTTYDITVNENGGGSFTPVTVWDDDFSTVSGSSSLSSLSGSKSGFSASYTISTVYASTSAVRLATNSAAGSIQTPAFTALTSSSNVTVTIKMAGYNAKTPTVSYSVTGGGTLSKSSYSISTGSGQSDAANVTSWSTDTFTISGATSSTKLTISTTSKNQLFIDAITIVTSE